MPPTAQMRQLKEAALEALFKEHPTYDDILQLVAWFQQEDDDASMEAFYDVGQAALLFEHLEELAETRDKAPAEMRLQSCLLDAVKASMGKAGGLRRLCAAPALVARLALSLDSEDVGVCTQVLELLAVLAVTCDAGYDSVRAAVEYFKLVKRERVRFERLVFALSNDLTPTAFKRDVMLFVNTLVNSAPDVEQRIEVRGDLTRAGMLEAVAVLKERNLSALALAADGELDDDAYELEVQVQVFESVLENDHEQCLFALDAANMDDRAFEGEGFRISLDDADALFSAVKRHAVEFECFGHLLAVVQHCAAIPAYDALGKEQWALLEIAAHRIVLGADDDFALSLGELKTVLGWKRALEARSMSLDAATRELDEAKRALKAGEDEIQQLRREQTAARERATTSSRARKPAPAPASPKLEAGAEAGYLKKIASLEAEVAALKAAAGGAPAGLVPLSQDARYSKFFKMLSMHLPRGAVEQKMRAEGFDVSVLDLDPSKPAPGAAAAVAGPRDDARYQKYFKMLQMHLPREAVDLKMRADGFDPAILDSPEAASPAAAHESPKPAARSGPPPLSEDPTFAPYFKMLAMHLPRGAVEQKMRADGLDPKVLDLDPSKPMPAPAAAPAKPKVARKLKPQPKPNVPMRPIFWSKISDEAFEKTVWRNLSDAKVKIDGKALEREFAKVVSAESAKDAAQHAKEDRPSKPKEVSIVEGKVSQNVGIALVKLKMTKGEIVSAVISLDEAKLDAARTELLLKCAPSADDACAVADYVGAAPLGRVEQFFAAIVAVPDYEDRLKCYLFRLRFDATCEALDDRLRLVTTACERLAGSERFARLLEIVLAVGNYLNAGSSRGGSYGFRLDALAKLGTIKALDNRRTLLHWLAAWCEAHDAELLDCASDFGEADGAARCSLAQWALDFRAVRQSIDLVQRHVSLRKKSAPRGCRFSAVMAPFHAAAVVRAAELDRRFEATKLRFERLVASFGEDPSLCGVETFFRTLVGDFFVALAKARLENDRRRQMEDRALAKQNAAAHKAKLKGSSGLVGETLASLKSEAAEDILAKLQGPRQRRARTKTSGSDAAASLAQGAAAAEGRMSRFIRRAQGVPLNSKAGAQLDALRGRRPPEETEARTKRSPTPPRKRASIDGQAELQALAGIRKAAVGPASPPPAKSAGGELFAKLAMKKSKKKPPPT
ncbi:formin homology 2 domain-containing protein [Pelagophyceae sp. CCMP2097]|nr:formin homology 2 domain-containing protein [Pelagophyceae sp. CCMP2097]